MEDTTAELHGLLDFLCGMRRLTAGMKKRDRAEFEFKTLWNDVWAIADRERLLHGEVAFPGVRNGWQDVRPQGGFDTVIGNPPRDRIKLQEVEWFATRAPELALASHHRCRQRPRMPLLVAS